MCFREYEFKARTYFLKMAIDEFMRANLVSNLNVISFQAFKLIFLEEHSTSWQTIGLFYKVVVVTKVMGKELKKFTVLSRSTIIELPTCPILRYFINQAIKLSYTQNIRIYFLDMIFNQLWSMTPFEKRIINWWVFIAFAKSLSQDVPVHYFDRWVEGVIH